MRPDLEELVTLLRHGELSLVLQAADVAAGLAQALEDKGYGNVTSEDLKRSFLKAKAVHPERGELAAIVGYTAAAAVPSEHLYSTMAAGFALLFVLEDAKAEGLVLNPGLGTTWVLDKVEVTQVLSRLPPPPEEPAAPPMPDLRSAPAPLAESSESSFLGVSDRAAQEAAAARPVAPGALERLLFVGSLPVMVPTLGVMRLMARRWGRVDSLSLFVMGSILCLLTLRSPLLAAVMLSSWAASLLLLGLRLKRAEDGVFLGYSDKTARRLIFGGLLTGIGLVWLIPWAEYSALSGLLSREKSTTVRKLVEGREGARRVVLPGEALAWPDRVYLAQTSAGPLFSRTDPRTTPVFEDANELWTRAEELAGSRVTLRAPIDRARAYLRFGAQYRLRGRGERHDADPKLTDPATRLYAAFPGATGRVWAVSEPVNTRSDPAAEAFLARSEHTGTLRVTFTDAELSRAYLSEEGPLPYMGVGLFPEPAPTVTAVQVLVPVAGSAHAIWVAYPEALAAAPQAEPGGIVLRDSDEGALLEHIQSRFPSSSALRRPVVLAAAAPGEFIRQKRLIERFGAGLAPKALLLLVPGLVLLFLGVRLGLRE